MQVRQGLFDPNANGGNGGTVVRLLNAAEVEGRGAEMDLALQMTEGLALTAGVGYVHSIFESFEGVEVINGELIDGSGNEVAFVPEWTANVALDHEMPLSGGAVWKTHLDYAFVDNIYDSLDGGRNRKTNQIPARGAFNGRLGYLSADENWSLFLWGKNLTDKRALVAAGGSAAVGIIVRRHLEPRTLGVTLNYNF